MAILKKYTKEETAEIMLVFNGKNNNGARQKLAKRMNRTITQLSSKANYERNRNNGSTRRSSYIKIADRPGYVKPKKQKETNITVTHLKKEITVKLAIIKLGNIAVIEIPTKSFNIDGVKIDW